MANLNRVTLIGRLTKDPEIRYLPSGAAVAAFDMAVNRFYKDKAGNNQEETLFIRVNLWGRQAEHANEFYSKGKEVFVDGRLRQRSWETQDGQKRSTIEVETFAISPLERTSRPPGAPASGAPGAETAPSEPPAEETGDDVPF